MKVLPAVEARLERAEGALGGCISVAYSPRSSTPLTTLPFHPPRRLRRVRLLVRRGSNPGSDPNRKKFVGRTRKHKHKHPAPRSVKERKE